jgi:hypothetical protein
VVVVVVDLRHVAGDGASMKAAFYVCLCCGAPWHANPTGKCAACSGPVELQECEVDDAGAVTTPGRKVKVTRGPD